MRKKLSILFFLSIITCIIVSSCAKDSATPNFGAYPTEIGKIITYKCATTGCHNTASAGAAANLDLSSYASLFKGSTSGSPVIPFRSDFSSLCYFINTYDELGPKNVPTMPLNETPLTKEEVKTIKNWIDNGAPDINGNIMWANDPDRKKYYVLNQGCDVVTVFDTKTQLPIRYINVGNNASAESPHMVKVSHDGQYWYVIFVNNNILQKFRTSDDVMVGEVDLGTNSGAPYNNWNTLVLSNDDKKAYCTSWQANSRIAVVDLQNMHLLHNLGGINDAHGTALNSTNDTIYITKQSGNYIYKIDTGFNSLNTVVLDIPSVQLNGASGLLDPHEILFSPDGSKYFVSCQASNEVRVMQTVGDVFLTSIPTGQYPVEMIISPTRNKLYVTCMEDPNPNPKILGSVSVIEMSNYSIMNYKVGYEPHGIGIDEINQTLIVSSRNVLSNGPTPHHTGVCGRNGFINYFNINTMQLLSKKTEVASDPYSLAVKP